MMELPDSIIHGSDTLAEGSKPPVLILSLKGSIPTSPTQDLTAPKAEPTAQADASRLTDLYQ